MKRIPKEIEENVRFLLRDYCDFSADMLQPRENAKEKTVVYTRKELAKDLKISLMTVDRAIRNKELLPIRIGSRVMFTDEAIQKWLSASTRKQNRKLNARIA